MVKRRKINIRAAHQNGMFHIKLANTEKRAEMTSHCVFTASMFHVNVTNEKNRQKNGIILRARCARNSDEKERKKRPQCKIKAGKEKTSRLISGAKK